MQGAGICVSVLGALFLVKIDQLDIHQCVFRAQLHDRRPLHPETYSVFPVLIATC